MSEDRAGAAWVARLKLVGTLSAALIAAGTVFGIVASLAWSVATTPVMKKIEGEARIRAAADSLLLRRLERVDDRFAVIRLALRYPPGSLQREAVLKMLGEQ